MENTGVSSGRYITDEEERNGSPVIVLYGVDDEIFILLTVITCCSCAKAPKEVMNEISAYDSAQAAQTAEIKTATFKEVTDNAKDINKTNNTNIKIQSINLPESEGMPTYTIKLDSSGRKELFDALSECDELNLHGGVTVMMCVLL